MENEFSFLEAQQRIHELIAQQSSLKEISVAIADWMAMVVPGGLVAIMRFDPDRNSLDLVPHPRFSDSYINSMQDVPVGPAGGTCGHAAARRTLVITEDISTDPRWQDFREVALAEGLAACCSTPIITGKGELLGTFAVYYRTPTAPSADEQRSLTRGAGLTALALLRDRDIHDHLALSQWHQTLFNNTPDGVYTFDLQGHFQSCNTALERIAGYSEQQILGIHFNDFVDAGHRAITQSSFDRACRGESVSYETTAIRADGEVYSLEVSNFPVIINGEIVGVYGICRDITERKEQETELRMLKRGVESSPHGILMVDAKQPDMPVVYANPAFKSITGYGDDEILGRNCRFLQGPETDPVNLEVIRTSLRNRTDADVVLRNYRKDGTPFWNRLLISPVFDNGNNCTHFIGIQQDITREKEQEAQLQYQASHDALTGLPNQISFSQALSDALDSHRGRPGQLVTLALNLDSFKPINEALGHPVGDQVLVAVAHRLNGFVNPNTYVARLAGDEFGVLLTHQAGHEAVMALADRILESLAQPIETSSQMVHLSASIGIASNALRLEIAEELIRYADLALQGAKRQGRNTWHWYRGEKLESTKHSVALRHDLLKALQQDQFEVHYQPIVEATSGRIQCVEALVRWQHPELGMISPGEFIPLAEQTGQIVALGQWIMKQACREVSVLNAHREHTLPVAVNISSMQFHREGFFEFIRETLHETGLDPRLLELEVTESVLLDGAGPVIALMGKLKDMGIRVALDDFGTGFSSLSYMRDLPTHKVKLDRSFVQNTATDHRIAAIVQGVITMAHHMDMSVVAEGVETREQQEELARRKCDLLQGYYFARPMPMAELRKLPDVLPAGHPTSGA